MEDVFVRSLLRDGRLRIGADAAWHLTDAALDDAKSALATQSLGLAGPPIVGSLDALLSALRVVYRFGRRALHPETTPAEADSSLRMPHSPRSAAEHLGADLALRFLPGLLQRLVARDPGDELVTAVKRLLCDWSLSGVLADLREPPTSPLDFGGHLGIRFLYAERLADRERPGWFPPDSASDGLEMVRQVLGRPTAPRIEEGDEGMTNLATRLTDEIVEPLKRRFVGRDEVVDLIALAVVAGEHLFLHGPPGTAKSALLRHFAGSVQGTYFEYMLTRFSEPNEIFGPVDIGKLREGTVVTVTKGMLPEAEFVFLDELFNANSAILNNLLTVLNERVYRRGIECHRLPLLSLFSASNHLPEDDALTALFDRFLIRCHVDNLKRDSMPAMLRAGWALEREMPTPSSISAGDLAEWSRQIYQVDLTPVEEAYRDAVFKIRDLGVAYSDRRAVKVLKLLAASALLCGRESAQPSDLWVLRYMWDREEQIEPLRSLVNRLLEERQTEPDRHPLSTVAKAVDAEQLSRQIDAAAKEMTGTLSLAAVAGLRERLADLADQASWIADVAVRDHLLKRTRECLTKLK